MSRDPAAPLVLVFDDDLIGHQDFLGSVARFVYRKNADHAVEDVRAIDPDLVLMDFSMGSEIDGATAVRTLRAAFPDLAIIAISSDSRRNRVMIEAGATDGVPKMTLAENLRHVLTHARR